MADPKPVRTRLKAAERRELILDAAEETFARLGYRAATMQDIAAASAVTQPMLYRHFSAKRKLFLAVIDRAFARVEAAWQQTSTLQEMGDAYLQMAVARPQLVRLRLQALAEGEDTEFRQRFQILHDRHLAVIREMVAKEQAAGRLAAEHSPEGLAGLFVALGAYIDVVVAMGPPAAASPLPAAGTLFWQLVRN